jgi:transketolase
MRTRFVSTLCDLAEADPRITLITGDLGFGVLNDFRDRFPSQFINAGVAEQNMTLLATGMALEGRIVFTYSIANFPTLRCLEMIRNDAAYHGANVKVVAIGGGFSYGPLGMSHHATEDLAILRSIPEVTVFSPTSLGEAEAVTRAAALTSGTCYLRLDKDAGSDGPADAMFEPGRPRAIRRGPDVAIFVTGGILSEVEKAAARLDQAGVGASVFAVHTITPMDAQAIASAAAGHPLVVTVEEHGLNGGFGSAILEALSDAGAPPAKLIRIGLGARFSSIVGSQQYLRQVYGLDAEAIAARVLTARAEAGG